ncbi:DUF7691 family protein [Rugosimonospora acidiphila]
MMEIYALDLDELTAVVGSGDRTLLRTISVELEGHLAVADEEFGDRIAEGAPTRLDAIRAVIDGGPFDDRYGYQYGYAYHNLCVYHGLRQNNLNFAPFRHDWLETVDEGLRRLGLTAVTVSTFRHNRPPSPLPYTTEPTYGEWSPAQCREAFDQWRASTIEQRAALGYDLREAVESCAEWLRAATSGNGLGIAAFSF